MEENRNDLKKKLISEGYFEVSGKIGQLKMPAHDGMAEAFIKFAKSEGLSFWK